VTAGPPGATLAVIKTLSFVARRWRRGVIGPTVPGKSSLARLLVGVSRARWVPSDSMVPMCTAMEQGRAGSHMGFTARRGELFAGTVE
jgi:ABC-type protease/lipase transport system fused ATPase/permease subunit